MRILRSLFVLGLFAVACALPLCASAQEETPDTPPSNPTDLFPSGGTQTPAAPPSTNHPSGGHHNTGGPHQRSGRRHDILVSQADNDPLEVRIAYRRAKTIALARDPGLATLLHEADASPTDIIRRGYLKEYYARLFASVQKIDPSPGVKTHVDLLTKVAEQRYDPKRREVGGDEDLVNGRGGGRRGRAQ